MWRQGQVIPSDGTREGDNIFFEQSDQGVDPNPVLFDNVITSLANDIEKTLNIEGQNSALADLRMGNFKLRELGDATAEKDAINLKKLRESIVFFPAEEVRSIETSSAGEVIPIVASPPFTSYPVGAICSFIVEQTNTRNVRLKFNTLTPRPLLKGDHRNVRFTELVEGDLIPGVPIFLLCRQNDFITLSGTRVDRGFFEETTTSTSYNWDVSTKNNLKLTLAHNTTISFSNLKDGYVYQLHAVQDATGGRSLTLPTTNAFGRSSTHEQVAQGANAETMISFIVSGNDVIYAPYLFLQDITS